MTLNYGNFINAIINFLIVALVLFSADPPDQQADRAEGRTPAAPAPVPEDVTLLARNPRHHEKPGLMAGAFRP